MVVKRDGCHLKSHSCHLEMVQNVEVRHQKLSKSVKFAFNNSEDVSLISTTSKLYQLTSTLKLPPDNAYSVAFSQRSNSPRLIEDETLNDNDIIHKLKDYEDGQEEPDSLRVDKKMQESSFPTNWKTIFLK
ncbi:uncharacterized protein TNCV_2388691 [Trichonephila clavipes]|nr:uncharacterized protein TNCV_2388691 [Trichonephila clavipes]